MSKRKKEREMETVYYISGPMRGLPGYNYPTFIEVEKALLESLDLESRILNPARSFDGDTTRSVSEYMQRDMEMVLKANVLVLLPGWENSEGARREVQLGIWTGKLFMLAEKVQHFENPADHPADWAFRDIDAPSLAASPRESALNEATHLITGDRNNQYGPPTQDFKRTAAMANAFGFSVNGEPLQAHHVAIFMMMLKTSRLAWSPQKRDSWVDAAGYAGCGYECAVEEAAA
jgi:Domain of unknown function (DUF6378)/Domain of unknown function (DUF4406)